MRPKQYDVGGIELSVQPYIYAFIKRVDLPIPDIDLTLEGVGGKEIPFGVPKRALDEKTGKLICFVEDEWTEDNDLARKNGRQLPSLVVARLRPMAFANQLLPLSEIGPDAVESYLKGAKGMLHLPYYESQRRFIDSRNHRNSLDSESSFRYENIHLYDISESNDVEVLERLLEDAAGDMYGMKVLEGGWEGYYPGEEENGVEFLQAAVLSEYARRYYCARKEDMQGGITTYFEQAVVMENLQRAMNTLIDVDLLNYDRDLLAEHLEERASVERGRNKRRASLLEALREDMIKLSGNVPLDREGKQRRKLNARWETEGVKAAKRFLADCVFSSRGASYGIVDRRDDLVRTGGEAMGLGDFPCYWMQEHWPENMSDKYCEGSPSAMLAAQFLNTAADERPWKKCPQCGHMYKYKQRADDREQAPGKKKSPDYCSDKCSNAFRYAVYKAEDEIIEQCVLHQESATKILKELHARAGDKNSHVAVLGKSTDNEKRWKKKIRKEQERMGRR